MRDLIKQQIANCISDFRLLGGARTVWRTPLIGYAAASDPLFDRLKTLVSPSHLTPRELLPGAETVIVTFLPFDERVVESNQEPGPASREWAIAYIETNRLLETINAQLVQSLEQNGYAAVALPPTHNFDEEQLISDWSHKHVAYIAGLGTFGLHHMLITAAGCAGRLGSLVTNAYLEPTPRPDWEACLCKAHGNDPRACSACVQRCPVDALSVDLTRPFDRHACYQVCLENARRYADEGRADVCGKCVSVVPCSFVDPVAQAQKT